MKMALPPSGAQGLLEPLVPLPVGIDRLSFRMRSGFTPRSDSSSLRCGLKTADWFAERSGTNAGRGSARQAEPVQTVRWRHAPLPVCCSDACSDRHPRTRAYRRRRFSPRGRSKRLDDSAPHGRTRQPTTGLPAKNVIDGAIFHRMASASIILRVRRFGGRRA